MNKPQVPKFIPESFVKWSAIIAFILLALASFVRGISYFPSIRPDLPPAVAELSRHGLPITVWAVFWCLSGLMLFGTLFVPHRAMTGTWRGRYIEFRWGDIAFLWTIGLYLAWGTAYYISYIEALIRGGSSTDYVLGIQYFAIGFGGGAGWSYWVFHRKV